MAQFCCGYPQRRVSVGVIGRKPEGLVIELFGFGIMPLACQNKPPINVGAGVLRIVLGGFPKERNGISVRP